MGELIPIFGVIGVFSWLSYSAYWRSKVRIEELRQGNSANAERNSAAAPLDANSAGEVVALRREVQSLRDTTTKFDMSFDAALERLEQRVDRMEGAKTGEPAYGAGRSSDTEPQVLRAGR